VSFPTSSTDGKLQKANHPYKGPNEYVIDLYFRTSSELLEAKQLNEYSFAGD